ncbi:MAG: hypothetical protein ACI9JM_000155 [Halioglobus sp.]|jgi:hypothetical protein
MVRPLRFSWNRISLFSGWMDFTGSRIRVVDRSFRYFYHQSGLEEFSLSSYAVIPTFKWNKQIQSLISIGYLEAFDAATYTIGGMIVFPGKRIDGGWTINQARGCTGLIVDRFDLTWSVYDATMPAAQALSVMYLLDIRVSLNYFAAFVAMWRSSFFKI